MGQVISRASVKINVPRFVEDYYGALKSGDLEDCDELKEYFQNTYHKLSPDIQDWMRSFISTYLQKNRLDDKRDLGGLFESLNLKLN